jgi:ABC-type Fe3+-hydroxamate transport system substrate-binding protein
MSRLLLTLAAISLAACASDQPELMNAGQTRAQGPDEFAILPTKPLVIPDDLSALPEPNPQGTNLADPTPFADAAAALGGNAAVLARPSGDGALVAAATRYGVDPTIRETLASEDLAFRRANDGRLLERLFNTNVYYQAYEPYSLDQYAELERLRRLGLRTSSVPPDPTAE